MNADSTVLVDLIRHGEPVGGRRYRGQSDDPLSDKGWQQMWEAVADHHPWDGVLASPLRRCREFAEALCQRHGLPLALDDRLMEIGFGQWEGRTASQICASDPDRLRRFWTDPLNNRPPGAEQLMAFAARVVAAWDDCLDARHGQHVLVVAHAGVIRMIMRHVLDMPLERLFRIQVGNAAITRIQVEFSDGGVFPRLLFHGGCL